MAVPRIPYKLWRRYETCHGNWRHLLQIENSEKLYAWYEKHLRITRAPDGSGAIFEWRDAQDTDKGGMTVWSIFPSDTKYFGSSNSAFMINYRVDDLDALLKRLQGEGVEIDPHREDYKYGRFARITDPEGRRVELWNLRRSKRGLMHLVLSI